MCDVAVSNLKNRAGYVWCESCVPMKRMRVFVESKDHEQTVELTIYL